MVAKKKSIFILACMFMASILLAAAFTWGNMFAPASAAERKTYTLPNTFSVYAAEWPNEIDNLEESNQLILHSTVNADGNAFSVPAGANAGFTQNNALGTAGWGLNDLTIKFYLNADPRGGGQIRLYFVNNVGWYNGSTAGIALWLWGIDAANGTANMAIQVKTESGEAISAIDDAVDVPVNFDYNYFTDPAVKATDAAGQSAAPAEGTLNTWRFYFDEDGLLKLDLTADGKDGAEARTMTVDLSTEAPNRKPGVESPQERLYDFSTLAAGETTNMVVWFADGLQGAMRITEVTSASEDTTQDFLPRNYVNAGEEPVFGGYNKLGFAKFSGNAVNNFSYNVSYKNKITLSHVFAEFLLDASNLSANDTFVMTYRLVDESGDATQKALELSFKKPGERAAGGKALLTVTAVDGTNRTAIVTDTEVPFTWEGISGAGGLTHTYNTVQIWNSVGSDSLTVNGTEIANVSAEIFKVFGEGDLSSVLSFGANGSAENELVIKRIETNCALFGKTHISSEWIVDLEADCVHEGSRHQECTVCGEILKIEPIPATGHTAGETAEENRKEATCEEEGSYEVVTYCTKCGAEMSRERVSIPATGHTAGETAEENRKEATCEKDGSYEAVTYCTKCGAELSRERVSIPATGHTAGEWVTDVPAGCTNNGIRHKECTVCGEILAIESLSATGHTAGEWVTDVPAGCTNNGIRHRECTVCGEILAIESLPATGHLWGAWTQTKAPTCTEEGEEQRVCMHNQDEIEKQTIDALGHDYQDGICVRCGAVAAADPSDGCGSMLESNSLFIALGCMSVVAVGLLKSKRTAHIKKK